jgi:hypothetical protein
MGDPRSFIEDDRSWVGERTKVALPILLDMAKHRRRLTYTELNQ